MTGVVSLDLKPYESYQEGADWLGAIPSHWEVFPGRVCFVKKKELNVGMAEEVVLSLSYGNVIVKPRSKLRGLVPESFETYQIVNPLDIVVRPTDLQNDRISLRVGISRHRGIMTSAYLCFRTTKRLAPGYGHLLLHSYDLMKVFYGLGSGLRQNLAWKDFKYLPCLVPPLSEQRVILQFLDYVDRRIRRYVRAKEKLVRLLEELKVATASEAVRGRIDVRTGRPYPAYKPSDNPWLRELPAHWETVRAKTLFLRRDRDVREEDEVITCFRDGTVTLRRLRRTTGFTESLKEIGYQGIRKGDLVIHAMDAFAGAVGVADSDGKGSPVYAVCSPRDNGTTAHYYAACLREMARQGWILALGKGIRERSTDFRFSVFGSQWLPLPPRAEQMAIKEYLDCAISRIDAAIANARREIEHLGEYRTRMIVDVVTGKLDVRKAVDLLEETAA